MKKFVAKTLDLAMDEARKYYDCSITQLEYEIIQNASDGFFGFGKKDAIIVANKKITESSNNIQNNSTNNNIDSNKSSTLSIDSNKDSNNGDNIAKNITDSNISNINSDKVIESKANAVKEDSKQKVREVETFSNISKTKQDSSLDSNLNRAASFDSLNKSKQDSNISSSIAQKDSIYAKKDSQDCNDKIPWDNDDIESSGDDKMMESAINTQDSSSAMENYPKQNVSQVTPENLKEDSKIDSKETAQKDFSQKDFNKDKWQKSRNIYSKYHSQNDDYSDDKRGYQNKDFQNNFKDERFSNLKNMQNNAQNARQDSKVEFRESSFDYKDSKATQSGIKDSKSYEKSNFLDSKEQEFDLEKMQNDCKEIEKELKDLLKFLPLDLTKVQVKPYDEHTLFILIDGLDAALLIGQKGYRYKSLSYLLFNWINAKYGYSVRLEIAQFLKNQEEMMHAYLKPIIESAKAEGKAQTKPLDGILTHIALKILREALPNKYIVFRDTPEGEKYITINDFLNAGMPRNSIHVGLHNSIHGFPKY